MVVTGDGLAREPFPRGEHELVSFPAISIPVITSTSLEIFTTPSFQITNSTVNGQAGLISRGEPESDGKRHNGNHKCLPHATFQYSKQVSQIFNIQEPTTRLPEPTVFVIFRLL